MATLSSRAQTLGYQRQPHANVAAIHNRRKGFRLTGSNARQILAQLTGDYIGENYGRTVPLIKYDRTMGARLGTITALRTAVKKK
jgi:hypothetical protein